MQSNFKRFIALAMKSNRMTTIMCKDIIKALKPVIIILGLFLNIKEIICPEPGCRN